MADPVLLDAFQVELFLPAGADETTADAARAALADPAFLAAVRRALRAVLDAVPALAALAASAEW